MCLGWNAVGWRGAVCGARMDDGSGLIMMVACPGNKMTMMMEG